MDRITCIRAEADKHLIVDCIKLVEENKQVISELNQLLEVTANEVRFKILYLLKEKNKLCPCDMADIFGMTVPAISQHLSKLRKSKFVLSKRDGTTIQYYLNPTRKPFLHMLLGHLYNQTTATTSSN